MRSSEDIKVGADEFTSRMALASTLRCPSCTKPVDAVSEHQYFMFDVVTAACKGCRMFTIVGAERWIQFPKWIGDKALMLGIKKAATDEDKRLVADYESAQQKGGKELDDLAKEVSDAQQKTWHEREPLL